MYIPLTFEGALAKCLYASGGIEGYFISGSDEYKYHLFSSGSSQFEVQAGTLDNLTIFMVGGGGGGGFNTSTPGQGGGAGEVKIIQNQRIFGGLYNINIGAGGDGRKTGLATIGGNGLTTTFSGSNFFYSASGGQGGSYFGFAGGALGASGNGFAGGANVSGHGGGGGGSTAAGISGGSTTSRGAGGTGYDYGTAGNIGRDTNFYACGGGGGGSATFAAGGSSCAAGAEGGAYNGAAEDALDSWGCGGGGSPTNGPAGNGGDGVVYIQYKINSYCKNFFNKTGDCGCKQLTFNVQPGQISGNFTGNFTASYYYTPCGTNSFISESVRSYFPETVCAEPNTFYIGPISSLNGTEGSTVYSAGIVSGGLDCSTGSVCGAVPLYTSSCSSSIYTYFNTVNNERYNWYIGRNSNLMTSSFYTRNSSDNDLSTNKVGRYVCQSSILSNTSGSNSDLISYSGAKCLVLNFSRTIATGGSTYTQTLYYYDQFGILQSVTKTYNDANPTWNYQFTSSFANGSPYFVSSVVSPNYFNFVMVGNDYTSSGLPTCGCP